MSVSRNSSGSCKASYDLPSEVLHIHFAPILLIKHISNSEFDLKGRKKLTLPLKMGKAYAHTGWQELMLLNCGAGEDSLESLGQEGDQTSQS